MYQGDLCSPISKTLCPHYGWRCFPAGGYFPSDCSCTDGSSYPTFRTSTGASDLSNIYNPDLLIPARTRSASSSMNVKDVLHR